MFPYQDNTLSPKERAKDLCARLSLNEKVGQLNQRLFGFSSFTRTGDEVVLSDDFCAEVEKWEGLGTLYGLYRSDPWSKPVKEEKNKDRIMLSMSLEGPLAKKAYNMAQRFVMAHSRFGIPMMLSTECPHGHQAADGYLLPVNLAAGATFDPALYREACGVCGEQLGEMGVQLALVSMLDMLRDPRWGRSEECYGEDPYLAGEMAKAAVTGFHDKGMGVVAKHLCAQGQTTGGVNASAASIGPRELREIHLPPVKAAIKAGVDGVMAAYNEIDGVPCHANRSLLTGILREEYGFDGIVMADGCALDNLNTLSGDPAVSAAWGLDAGVDISLWDNVYPHLAEAVERGLVTEAQIDEAVIRVLTLKFESGLFEHPYLDESEPLADFDKEKYPQSLQMAREGAVLLENDGVLPLKAGEKIAVIGSKADDVYGQLGDYTPPVREGAYATLLDGLKALASDVVYDDGEDIERAAALAKEADAVVLALGGSSSRFGSVTFDRNGAATSAVNMDCGEGIDCGSLKLPGNQEALYDALSDVMRGKGGKLVTVIIAGRPYALGDRFKGEGEALMYSFYPGPWGGQALAELILGLETPSGRLPASMPYSVAQLPVYYNVKAGAKAMSYSDDEKLRASRYTFGDGKGYAEIAYSDITLETVNGSAVAADDTPLCAVSMTIENQSDCEGWAVPMLFIRDCEADVVRRVSELKAWDKVRIPAHTSRQVRLVLTAEALSVWNRRMVQEVQKGRFELTLKDGCREIWTGEWTAC